MYKKLSRFSKYAYFKNKILRVRIKFKKFCAIYTILSIDNITENETSKEMKKKKEAHNYDIKKSFYKMVAKKTNEPNTEPSMTQNVPNKKLLLMKLRVFVIHTLIHDENKKLCYLYICYWVLYSTSTHYLLLVYQISLRVRDFKMRNTTSYENRVNRKISKYMITVFGTKLQYRRG